MSNCVVYLLYYTITVQYISAGSDKHTARYFTNVLVLPILYSNRCLWRARSRATTASSSTRSICWTSSSTTSCCSASSKRSQWTVRFNTWVLYQVEKLGAHLLPSAHRHVAHLSGAALYGAHVPVRHRRVHVAQAADVACCWRLRLLHVCATVTKPTHHNVLSYGWVDIIKLHRYLRRHSHCVLLSAHCTSAWQSPGMASSKSSTRWVQHSTLLLLRVHEYVQYFCMRLYDRPTLHTGYGFTPELRQKFRAYGYSQRVSPVV